MLYKLLAILVWSWETVGTAPVYPAILAPPPVFQFLVENSGELTPHPQILDGHDLI